MKSYNIIFNSCEIAPLYISTIIKLPKSLSKQTRLFISSCREQCWGEHPGAKASSRGCTAPPRGCMSKHRLTGRRVKHILTPAASRGPGCTLGCPGSQLRQRSWGRCACLHLAGSMWLLAFTQIPLFGKLSAFYMVLQFFLYDLTFLFFVLFFFSKSPPL